MTPSSKPQALPREIADGIYWLGECLHLSWHGKELHNYQSMYLVTGDDCSLLVEAGHPKYVTMLMGQLEDLFANNSLPPLRYLFVTHVETPHSGGVMRMLEHFPDLTLCGDVSDVHLYAPAYADRVLDVDAVEEGIDLGGTTFKAVQAVIRDHSNTCWGFDTKRHVLFSADGLAYAHYHEPHQCGSFAEEASALDVADMTTLFSELALYWTRFVDMDPYVARLDELIDELGVEMIAPTHGLPVSDIAATLPAVREGLRAGAEANPDKDTFYDETEVVSG